MFLSKVTLNPRHRMTYRLLADIYAQHRFVMSAFPDLRETAQAEEGTQAQQTVLYRLETTKRNDTMAQRETLFFLVQSVIAPDWEKTDSLHPDVICTSIAKEWNPTFAQGEHYRFRLRTNPTICRVNRDKAGQRHPKREGLFTEEEQRDWLIRAAERGGFRVNQEATLITPQGKREGAKPPPDGAQRSKPVTCYMVDFDGLLCVTDAKQFADTLREGVGRSKAWGCGLVSLARA